MCLRPEAVCGCEKELSICRLCSSARLSLRQHKNRVSWSLSVTLLQNLVLHEATGEAGRGGNIPLQREQTNNQKEGTRTRLAVSISHVGPKVGLIIVAFLRSILRKTRHSLLQKMTRTSRPNLAQQKTQRSFLTFRCSSRKLEWPSLEKSILWGTREQK